ncbi:MAG TPA: hypothetical protein VGC34_01420 [Steroidobacteraceae bacterium]
MNTFVRLMPVLLACAATQVFAGDPPAPKATDPEKSAAPAVAASADSTPTANPAPATATPETTAAATAAKPGKLVLNDKTLTNDEVNRMFAQGYRPQKGRGDDVLYCRNETPVGTRFGKKVCKTADQIKAQTQDSKDYAAQQQMPSGNPAGK